MNVSLAPSAAPVTREVRDARLEPLARRHALALAAGAVAAFHLAYAFSSLGFLIAAYLYCLFQLARLPTARRGFYTGLAIGYAIYAPHLAFFWTIFGWPSVALWSVLAFWLGLFVALASVCRRRLGWPAVLLVPLVWTGLEYFRSELYFLRFSWLGAGYAFSNSPRIFTATHLGMYGVGFVLMLSAAVLSRLGRKWRGILAGAGLAGLAGLANLPAKAEMVAGRRAVRVAGVQMEVPSPLEVPGALDKLIAAYPETELIVLSEYTFGDPVPDVVKRWCRRNHRYLIAGGKEFISDTEFYNTAFVVDPNAEVVFRQVKSVPIQFFKDGRPAPEQRLWESPWGRFGIGICYDLSYRRVMDELIRQGAQAIIAPTMDVADWGEAQHRLHARVAPVRAAEYGVPIFRVCSSGISQLIAPSGRVVATAPYPGQGATIAGLLDPAGQGHRPIDHWLGPLSVLVTAAMLLWLLGKALLGRSSK
jgi:apolipoprotein N-acyltransferase